METVAVAGEGEVNFEVEVEGEGEEPRASGTQSDERAAAGAGDEGVQPRGGIGGDRGRERDASEPVTYPNPRRRLAKYPTKRNLPVSELIKQYGASNVIKDIEDFLGRREDIAEGDVSISKHNRVDVWHKLYLHHEPLPFAPSDPLRRDVVRASPPVLGPRGGIRQPAVWDVALYLERPNRLREFGPSFPPLVFFFSFTDI